MKDPNPSVSNPGPSWGYKIIDCFEKYLPGPLFRLALGTGTAIGMACMPAQRRASSDYWLTLKGYRPGLRQQYSHFRSFMDGLVLKLRAGRYQFPKLRFSDEAHRDAFERLCASDKPALFGTFHVGHSDMMGCMLRDFDRSISMVRLKVRNSMDTDTMERVFGDTVKFLWVNQPEEVLFSLKEALQNGESIAMQCDRTEFSSRTCDLQFLGKKRTFPMTIYFLSYLFQCQVVFSYTGPLKRSGEIEVYTSPVFDPCSSRQQHLKRAKEHYQDVIDSLQNHLHRYPDLWFNFIQLDECFSIPKDRDA